MSKRANSIVDMIVMYVIISVILYAFSMLFLVVKYATLTAIDKLKKKRGG